MNVAAVKARNTFKTFILVAGLTGLLLVIGQLIGGASGLILFAGIAVVFNFVMYWFSGPDRAEDEPGGPGERGRRRPELHRMIARLAERAGVPEARRVRHPRRAAQRVRHRAAAPSTPPSRSPRASSTRCRPRELEGVLAHEMAHIKNRDILIASIAAMVAGAISAIANFLQFSLLFGGRRRQPAGHRRDAGHDHPGADRGHDHPDGRSRASASTWPTPPAPSSSAIRTRWPTRWRRCSAAPRRSRCGSTRPPPRCTSSTRWRPALAAAARRCRNLFSTHPPMEERVARLRRMAGASSLHARSPSSGVLSY